MNSQINLMEIYIADMMGLILTVMALPVLRYRTFDTEKDRKYLLPVLLCTLVSCIADPFVFYCDGKPGILQRMAVFIGNTWLYMSTTIVGPAWVGLVSSHIDGRISRFNKILIIVLCSVCAFLLIVNCFTPIVFSIDASNIYRRGELYNFFNIAEAIFMIDGLCVYLNGRRHGGVLKFFPVWQFLIPAVIGMILQMINYGISIIWPCIAISCTCLLMAMQRETVYLDHLTGIYNRAYFDLICDSLRKARITHVTIMMMDVNNFKQINDSHGHAEGDEALKIVSHLISSPTGSVGTALRYAGDEFIVLLNTVDTKIVNKYLADIRINFDSYNKNSDKTYVLSVAIGYSVMDLNKSNVDETMRIIDKRMYEDKKCFYDVHPNMNRRRQ